MKKTALVTALMATLAAAQMPAQAETQSQAQAGGGSAAPVIDAKRIYLGGGLGFHQAGGGSSQGFQFFGGYDFDFILNDDISSALEIGYMDSGNFDVYGGGKGKDATGLWASMVESVPLTRKASMLARLGYDFGDDDGFMIGAGLQYRFNTKAAMRMEYVTRQHVAGLQVNALFRF